MLPLCASLPAHPMKPSCSIEHHMANGKILKVEAEEVLPMRLEGRIKDFSRLATG